MDLFYTVVIFSCVFGMIALTLDVGKNTILSKSDIKWFRVTFVLITIGSIAEWLGYIFDLFQLKPYWLHALITITEFSISPFIAITLARSCGFIHSVKPMSVIMYIHAFLEIIMQFFGGIFYIDSNGVFQRGPYYFIYMLTCAIAFLYSIAFFIMIGKKAKIKNLITTILIYLVMICGQAACTIDIYTRTGYISLAMTTILLYIYIQSIIRQQMLLTINIEQELAYHDSLTGVNSRASFDKETEKIDSQILSDKYGKMFAICECDLNNLKIINDSFGHDFGDHYIKHCCNAICSLFKPNPVYRIGGDEFVIIIQGSEFEKCEQLQNFVTNYTYSEMNRKVDFFDKYFFSFGFAVYDPKSDNSFKDVLRRADKKMYENKKELKKQIVYN